MPFDLATVGYAPKMVLERTRNLCQTVGFELRQREDIVRIQEGLRHIQLFQITAGRKGNLDSLIVRQIDSSNTKFAGEFCEAEPSKKQVAPSTGRVAFHKGNV